MRQENFEPTELMKEKIPPCVICGKVWRRMDVDNYVFFQPVGVMCRNHHGVMDFWNEMLAKY